jgi:spore maturation protein CgeB
MSKLKKRVGSEFAAINVAGSDRMEEIEERFKETKAKYKSDKIMAADVGAAEKTQVSRKYERVFIELCGDPNCVNNLVE